MEEIKWLTVGGYECVANKYGKVIASVQVGLPSAPLQPMTVIVNGKNLGQYVSRKAAKEAVEDALLGNHSRFGSMIEGFRKMREAGDI